MRLVLMVWLLHAALLASALLAAAVVLRCWVSDRFLLLASALAAVGAVALGVGVLWWLSPVVGLLSSRVLAVASGVVLAAAGVHRRRVLVEVVRQLWVPLAAASSYAVVVLALGFLRGGVGTPSDTAATRFTWRLPPDNVLPFFFGRHVELFGNESVPPAVSGWLSSDRPPLQSAMWLTAMLWHQADPGAMLDYQVLGVLLQSTWVLGVWVLLGVLAVRRSSASVALGACASCSVIVVNSFYVWPKLLAAAFALAALALVLRPVGARPWGQFGLSGALAALAYLAHGGVAFVLVPVAIVGLQRAWHAERRWRSIGAAAGCAMGLVAPWTLYQRLVDPPGTRLLSWMLAGVQDVDPRSPFAAVTDQYAAVGPRGVIENKVDNFARLLGHGWDASAAIHNVDGWDGTILSFWRSETFYSFIPAVGLLLVLALGWFVGRERNPRDLRAATVLAAVTGAGLVFWALAMFGPGTTFLHQGTFAFVLLAACALSIAGSALSLRLTSVVVGAAAVVTLVVLLPQKSALGQPVGPGSPVLASAVIVLMAALVFFVGLLVLAGRSRVIDPTVEPGRSREPVDGTS